VNKSMFSQVKSSDNVTPRSSTRGIIELDVEYVVLKVLLIGESFDVIKIFCVICKF